MGAAASLTAETELDAAAVKGMVNSDELWTGDTVFIAQTMDPLFGCSYR
jgi:hypothetical protein